MPVKVETGSLEAYRESCLNILTERLAGYDSVAAVAADEERINAYPRLDSLSEPRDVVTLDAASLSPDELERAVECVLDGRFMAEHTAAGEATRLKLGTKYLINPFRVLTLERCLEMLSEEEGRQVTAEEFLEISGGATPQDVMDLSLGLRHMLQMAFDLTLLARQAGRNPETVLENQWMLVILNETTAEEILGQFIADRFMGFAPERVLFMIQASFEGVNLENGRFFFDPNAPRRLHNHGQMAMQTTAEGQVFRLEPDGRKIRLSRREMADVLARMDDKLSYNIEDLGYLTGAIDLEALALALKLSDQGFRMVMEIVANNPLKPQKGGLAAWDEELGRNVMIESFQLMGLPNEEIKYLNKNFNHYPRPLAAFEALAEGLPMPIAVKGDYIYFQPVQGDLNFALPTAFVRRKELKPISNWKSAATTPAAIKAMAEQDRQPGFKDFCQDVLKRSL